MTTQLAEGLRTVWEHGEINLDSREFGCFKKSLSEARSEMITWAETQTVMPRYLALMESADGSAAWYGQVPIQR